MVNISEVINSLQSIKSFFPLIRTVFTIVLLFIIFRLILSSIKKRLLIRSKSKKQLTNIKVFSRALEYFFLILLIVFSIFSYVGSWAGLGVGLGLLTAAIGFALQKPISSVVAWIIIVTRRPFEIGDRISMGGMTGDVTDITLTHIHLGEVEGNVPSQEISGRIVLIPNSVFFEQNTVNYTMFNDFILNQVIVNVTYESNLDKAIEIALEAANKFTKDFHKIKHKPFPKVEKPYTRLSFGPSGINVNVRYSVPVKSQSEVSSDITKEIYFKIKKTKDVELAYPHTEVILRKK